MERALCVEKNNISLPCTKNSNWNYRSDKTEYSERMVMQNKSFVKTRISFFIAVMLQIELLVNRHDLYITQNHITYDNIWVYRSSVFGWVKDLTNISWRTSNSEFWLRCLVEEIESDAAASTSHNVEQLPLRIAM